MFDDTQKHSRYDWIPIATTITLMGLTMSLLIITSLVKLPSFDGAMMLNTARTFSDTGKYGYFYNEFFYFPSQTDGLIVILATIIFKAFGEGIFTAQLPNLIFNILFIFGIRITIKQFTPTPWYSMLVAASVVVVPGFTRFAVGGYGEIPTLTFALWSFIALHRSMLDRNLKLAFLAGLILGAAFITKVIGLFFIVPTVSLLFLYCYEERKTISTAAAVAAGGLILPTAWEGFRMAQLGYHGYRQWWSLQIHQIRHQSGAGAIDHTAINRIFQRAMSHLSILGHLLQVNTLASGMLLATAFVGYYFARKTLAQRADRLLIDLIALTAALFFAWWIVLLPTRGAWLRRIEDGLLALYVCYGILGALLLRQAQRSPALHRVFIAVVLPVAAISILKCIIVFAVQVPASRLSAQEVLQGAHLLADLPPESKIFGVGWWQAPQLSLFSNRRFYNYEHWTIDNLQHLHDAYFVTDGYARVLGRNQVNFVLKSSPHNALLASPSVAIYRINAFHPYPAISRSTIRASALPSFMNRRGFNFTLSRGIYHDFWSRPESEIVLGRTNEQMLAITIFVPRSVIEAHDGSTTFHISSPNCVDRSFVVVPNLNSFRMPLRCDASPSLQTFVVRLSINAHAPFVRQIDADNRLLGFIFESIKLMDADSRPPAGGRGAVATMATPCHHQSCSSGKLRAAQHLVATWQ